MYYSEIKKCDIANGPGVRVSLFVSGCTNRCPECFQSETWSFTFGEKFSEETMSYILNCIGKTFVQGLTVLGGEPLEPKNQEAVLNIITKVREKYPDKDIWVYTGFKYEDLIKEGTYCHTEYTWDILNTIDVLVDGKFDINLKDISLKFRGSSNQRIIDVKKTVKESKVHILNI